MTQRIEPFLEHDSKNWKNFMIFLLKELNLFWIWLEKLNFFSWMRLTELNFFYDSKNWFFSEWQRFCWIRLKESNLFFEYVPKNRTFFWKYVQRTFFSMILWIELIFSALPIEWNTWENDSKNWTYCNKTWLKELNFLWNYICLTWPKELNFLEYDSKNWTLLTWLEQLSLFFWRWHRFFFFERDSKNWVLFSEWQRFCWIRLKESNLFFWMCPKESNFFFWKDVQRTFFSMIHRIELIFSALPIECNTWENESKNWTYCNKTWHKELNFLWNLICLTWPKELNFLEYDSKNWTLLTWLTELSFFFFESDSKNWTLFHFVSKN